MRRTHLLVIGLAAALIVLTVAALIIAPRIAQGPEPAIQELASTAGGPGEGVTVHGHWTLEVRNPDGSLVEHREFENALYNPTGPETLVKLLGRQNSIGGWEVHLISPSSIFSPFSDGSSGSEGVLVESSSTGTSPNMFKTLTLTVSTGPAKLRLNGSATAQRDGRISIVETRVARLPASAPPSSEYMTSSGYPFTSTGLTGGDVILTSGQQVTVTVEITFS
jgi:hypothetical protein